MAVELFRILYKNNEHYDPVSVRTWAIRNGWTPNGADELKYIAQAILDRRPIRGSKGLYPWRKDLIEHLRKEAEKKNTE